CELWITGGVCPFLGSWRNMLDLGSDQKGLFAENPYIKQKKFGDVDPKIATSQKAHEVFHLKKRKKSFKMRKDRF
ncbi:MAG: hypothetical protein CW346_01925, partial [Bacillaceae bacterium]|nr:hypothetical protein [Bacillaceae bacterium]